MKLRPYRLKRLRNYHRMGMIPGSSAVEHSAVNGELQIQELVSLASVSSLGTIPKHPFLVPLMSPNTTCTHRTMQSYFKP
jgi:hypothetical protein